MSRSALLLVAASAVSLGACVPKHFPNATTTQNGALRVSCDKSDLLSTGAYHTLTCNFENLTASWMQLQVRSARVAPPPSRLLEPQEIQTYMSALEIKRERDRANRDALLAGLVLTAAVATAVAGDDTVDAVADLTVVTADLVATVADTNDALDAAVHGGFRYGPEHVSGGPIDIPAGLLVQRQVVLEAPKGVTPTMVLCFEEHQCISVRVHGHRKRHR